MTRPKRAEDVTGSSNSSINEAIQDALDKVEKQDQVVVIETKGFNAQGGGRRYEVTLGLIDE